MKDKFLGYYRPTEKEFKKLWDKAVFVLDTNILLNLYRYPKEAREELFNVLENLGDRIWVPFHSALEYQRNRLSVIAEQKKRYTDVRKILDKTKSTLVSELDSLQLKKRHASIKTEELIEGMGNLINNFVTELESLEEGQIDVTDNDTIRERIDKMLKEKVGDAPANQKSIDKIYDEGDHRYIYQIPPGFKDSTKEKEKKIDEFAYGGVLYKRKFGDLIIWKQTLAKAKNDSLTSVIFLTDDEKSDWWWQVDAQGKKRLGPRPELKDEIARESGVKLFYMYNSEQFLKYSTQYLHATVSEESISQVREVARYSSQKERLSYLRHLGYIAEKSIYYWLLNSKFPNANIEQNKRTFPDFIVFNDDSSLIGVEVKFLKSPNITHMLLKDTSYRCYYELNEGDYTDFFIVFVFEDSELIEKALEIIERRLESVPAGLTLIVGQLQHDMKGEHNEYQFMPVAEYTT